MKKTTIITGFILFSLIGTAQPDRVIVDSTVQKSTIQKHIYFLASDELRGRKTGSPEIDMAADYIANSFREYGVEPIQDSYFQMVPLLEISTPSAVAVQIKKIDFSRYMVLNSGNMYFEGKGIYLGYGKEDDFAKADVEGKIVVVSAGDTTAQGGFREAFGARRAKYERAKRYGAAGLIELFSTAEWDEWDRYANYFNSSKTTLASDTSSIPHIWIGELTEDRLSLKSGKGVKLSISVSGVEYISIAAKNVVGVIPGTDPELKNQYVIYSAHYDHVGVGTPNDEGDSIFNGARDNAVGVVTVMSMAENLAMKPTKRSSLFILFTGEEMGLLGSRFYTENPLISLKRSVFCFNSDNGGYNDTTIASIIGLERTTASENIKRAASAYGLVAKDDPAPEQGLFDRSDNVHFARAGIPAPTYSLGFNAFDDEIRKYYHQVTDQAESLDYEYLLKFFRSYVLSGRLIGNAQEIPFWKEGDIYYQSGVNLYSGQ